MARIRANNASGGGGSNVDISFYKQTGAQAYADSGYTYSVTPGKKYIISFFRTVTVNSDNITCPTGCGCTKLDVAQSIAYGSYYNWAYLVEATANTMYIVDATSTHDYPLCGLMIYEVG